MTPEQSREKQMIVAFLQVCLSCALIQGAAQSLHIWAVVYGLLLLAFGPAIRVLLNRNPDFDAIEDNKWTWWTMAFGSLFLMFVIAHLAYFAVLCLECFYRSGEIQIPKTYPFDCDGESYLSATMTPVWVQVFTWIGSSVVGIAVFLGSVGLGKAISSIMAKARKN